MIKIILWTTACSFSGSLLYFAIRKINKRYMSNSSKNNIVTNNFINYGSILGGAIGFFKGYYGISIIKYLTNKLE